MLDDFRENADKAEAPGVSCTDVPCIMISATMVYGISRINEKQAPLTLRFQLDTFDGAVVGRNSISPW
jgi:hypothetical protein